MRSRERVCLYAGSHDIHLAEGRGGEGKLEEDETRSLHSVRARWSFVVRSFVRRPSPPMGTSNFCVNNRKGNVSTGAVAFLSPNSYPSKTSPHSCRERATAHVRTCRDGRYASVCQGFPPSKSLWWNVFAAVRLRFVNVRRSRRVGEGSTEWICFACSLAQSPSKSSADRLLMVMAVDSSPFRCSHWTCSISSQPIRNPLVSPLTTSAVSPPRTLVYWADISPYILLVVSLA